LSKAEDRPTRGGHERERRAVLAVAALSLLPVADCTPTVEVKAPEQPITINLNIKLDADVRVRLEEEAKQDVKTKPIF
jgi:YnbE-like lipoprotein